MLLRELQPTRGFVWRWRFKPRYYLSEATCGHHEHLPCGCLLWTPQRCHLQCGWSCATSGSTWGLSQTGSWPWSAPGHTLQSPALYHRVTLFVWISPGETWREDREANSKLTLAVKSNANNCSIFFCLVKVIPRLLAEDVKVRNSNCSLILFTETRGPTHMFTEPSIKWLFEQ